MPYTSVNIARYIVALSNSKGVPINMTKLQKLLYVAYGLYLAVNNTRLFEEHPQAWPYGPVFPTTRNKLLNVNFYEIDYNSEEFSVLREDSDINALLTAVFNAFGGWTASQLTVWSHMNGTPWERTTEIDGFKWGDQIPDEFISSYFKMILRNGRRNGQ